ncbi:hypothetical protein [Rubrobacter indicoceani]|uniref:hypothetical protein n=1 Tax=Rubrobacter indicoceani TaxID=2051957 RepID=UPI000E5AE4E1|nr:hypothetical protein [Rubrobacter indicoceani]
MSQRGERLGYEFTSEGAAKELAAELDRRFDEDKLTGLRVYRIVWNQNFLVEATFSKEATEADRTDARALLGESGTPVHPDDLEDYKRARPDVFGGWFRRFFKG